MKSDEVNEMDAIKMDKMNVNEISIDQMKHQLERALEPNRFAHSIGVMETAVLLADKYGENMEKARVAGLLHDCARGVDEEETIALCKDFAVPVDKVSRAHPVLLHAPLGAAFAKEYYGVEDPEILDAIRWHTIGKQNMTQLEKIIFLADYIEPNRYFPRIEELRKIIFNDLDTGLLQAVNSCILHVIDKGELIHPGTIMCRNYLIGMQSTDSKIEPYGNRGVRTV